MEALYKHIKAILLFVVIVLVADVVGGAKFTQNMCIAILFSMLILNADNIAPKIKAVANNLTSNT